MTYYYHRTLPTGVTRSGVGPFTSPERARRAIAQALTDNGYERDRKAATDFAATVGTPKTHTGSGVTYWIDTAA